MFFGLTNSPRTFQQMMVAVQIAQGWLKVYMDDILLANKGDQQEMIRRLLIVLQILKINDLYIKPEKCIFFTQKVEFLGFIIKDEKIKMDPTKISGLLDWPAPTTLKQVRSFISFCNFYHRFIDKYSDKCTPLNQLL